MKISNLSRAASAVRTTYAQDIHGRVVRPCLVHVSVLLFPTTQCLCMTVCYLYTTETFLMELRDEGWGGGSLGLFYCLLLPLWYPHFLSPSHRGVRTRKNETKSDDCLTRNLCKMEDGSSPTVELTR